MGNSKGEVPSLYDVIDQFLLRSLINTLIQNMTLANSRRTITSPYYHTWKTSQRNDISFEDLIIVSDEEVPPQNAQGLAYTLWTKDHEQNRLFVDGRRRKHPSDDEGICLMRWQFKFRKYRSAGNFRCLRS